MAGDKRDGSGGLKAEVFGTSNPDLRPSDRASRAFPASLASRAWLFWLNWPIWLL
jgi:hypothetical protein